MRIGLEKYTDFGRQKYVRLLTSVDSTKQFTSGIFTQREILYCPYLAWIPLLILNIM